MFRRFVLITLACSVLPLLGVGWGISVYYSRLAATRAKQTFKEIVTRHKRSIELFLDARRSAIQLTAKTHSLEHLCNPANLAHTLRALKREYGDSFTDLGVIADTGKHLAYVGPYALMDKNYSRAHWFKEVMARRRYTSDMFLGFRGVPHFIIAARRDEGGRKWILRATVNTEVFYALVASAKIGSTGDVYLLNSRGIYQTRPRLGGQILARDPLALPPIHEKTGVRTVEEPGVPSRIVAHAWLPRVRWALIVKQDQAETFRDVDRTRHMVLAFLHLSALAILLVAVLTARHMIRTVRKRDELTSQLNNQLLQASKMASIGELAAGVAHEVNNPLAIIMTEREILLDQADRTPALNAAFDAQLRTSLAQIETQCKRGKHTTQNLLRFSRRTESRMEELDLNASLGEVINLLEREAMSSGIKFFAHLDENLPLIVSDPSLLQQVFLNILSNAIDAHETLPYGRISVSTSVRTEQRGTFVEVIIEDTGVGIRPEHLDKIFDPFFTTKPVGKGTGLGLSICYGIVKRLGGDLRVKSNPEQPTEFQILLPLSPPAQGRPT